MSAKRIVKKPVKKPAKTAAKKVASTPKRSAAKKAAPKRAAAKKAPSRPQIVHWEIQSQNPDKLHGFYTDAFGWEINANNPMRYGMVASGGKDGINGGIGGSPENVSRVLVYANVPSIDHALERIEGLGGKTLMPRTDLGMVVMALYADPEGNVMGIIED
jgi:predicted enzyme related to lactoylglutathione lyase